MECSYCKKIYANSYTLKTHQSSTKKCLLLQNEDKNRKLFSCSFCNKELTTNMRLQYHLNCCKKNPTYKPKSILLKVEQLEEKMEEQRQNREKMEEKMEEQEYIIRQNREQFEYELKLKSDEIKRLEALIEIPKVSNITNIKHQQIINNHISITNYMTPERVKEIFSENFTLETLLGSQKELANFTVDNFLLGKDRPIYICTDRSRKKFAFVNEDGKQVEDVNCEKLVRLIIPGFTKVHEIYEEALFTPFNISNADFYTININKKMKYFLFIDYNQYN